LSFEATQNDPSHPPWLAVADLTSEVDEGATLTPSFTRTDVISKTVSHVFNWGVKLDTQSQRIYTQSITFRIDELNDERCKDRATAIARRRIASANVAQILAGIVGRSRAGSPRADASGKKGSIRRSYASNGQGQRPKWTSRFVQTRKLCLHASREVGGSAAENVGKGLRSVASS